MESDRYLAAAAIGASCGLRTFLAPAVAAGSAGNAWTPLLALLAVAELVADKLPVAPARTRPLGLAARFVSGFSCGASLAARRERSAMIGGLAGAFVALAAAYGGYSARHFVAERGWIDAPFALVEDGVALATALVAVGEP